MKADLQQFSPDFTHVPFPVILAQLITKWKKEHDGTLPSTTQEKTQFQDSISELGGGYRGTDNFRECQKFKYLAYVPYQIPDQTQEIFNHEKCNNINGDSKLFWLLSHAVKKFVENEGQGFLPLSGSLPDMTTKSHNYVKLQQIFRERAAQDFAVVKKYVQNLLISLNKSPDDVPDERIALFCKQASLMKVFYYPPIQHEYDPSRVQKSNIPFYEDCGKWYLTLRAASSFYRENGRLPGDRNDNEQSDFEQLRKHALHLIRDLGIEPIDDDDEVLPDKFLREICRFGGSQIHTVAAFIGGVAAQEIIKLVTKQWCPVQNIFVYSGITGESSSFAL
eukprot:TRINITY_DN5377_c0_g2_i12.p1 TRINITY_DN5377_c0_g2~~TRINITY_DN5377_c0_g2_i12.p1  ORF type:complete len:335 (+),score=61.65 TRINITY_DN5377_c0_g2_i12:941-1945(+)